MPDLKLALKGADATGKTVTATWTFNTALDGVSQSAVRIDWGDGTVSPIASGTATAEHAYTTTYEKMVMVKLLGNDVTETERINIMPGTSPPYFNPTPGAPRDMQDVYAARLEDARKVMPQPTPWLGPDNAKGLKPVNR